MRPVKRNLCFKKNHFHPVQPLPRQTRQQQVVLSALEQQADPLSAQALYRLLQEQQTIGRATVYRALETLKLHGLVLSRAGINGELIYSPMEQDQHYLTCLQCAQSFPLNTCPVQELEAQLQHSASFKIYYHTLEFFGICSPCQMQLG